MGISICEEGDSSLESHIEINPLTSSNGTHHDCDDHQDEDQDQDQDQPIEDKTPAIVEKLESLELKDEKEEYVKTHKYPLRDNAVSCAFYLKTGTCKFGFNCRFNHPPNRVFKVVGEKEKVTEEKNGLVSDAEKNECKYFSTPGGCKFGDACKYDHSTEKVETEGQELNFLGLPIRPLEKECTFYMRNGTCGYGANCRYHHPDPTAAKEFDGSSQNGYPLTGDNNSPKTHEILHSPEVSQGTLPEQSNGTNSRSTNSYHQRMPQISERNPNQGQATMSLNKPSLPHQIAKTTDPAAHYERLIQIEEFPERPGQPDCDYFLKTGDCKYRSACRYNHPLSRGQKLRLPPLSAKGRNLRSAKVLPIDSTDIPNSKYNNTRENGEPFPHHHQQMQNGNFPERPGQPECEYFMNNGDCKFRSACRYHHPRNRMSTSSPCALNEKGLPLRPGGKICRNYQQQGTCKYGRKCQFHHPDDDNSTAAPAVALEDHGSADVAVAAADSEISTSNNAESEWGDSWIQNGSNT